MGSLLRPAAVDVRPARGRSLTRRPRATHVAELKGRTLKKLITILALAALVLPATASTTTARTHENKTSSRRRSQPDSQDADELLARAGLVRLSSGPGRTRCCPRGHRLEEDAEGDAHCAAAHEAGCVSCSSTRGSRRGRSADVVKLSSAERSVARACGSTSSARASSLTAHRLTKPEVMATTGAVHRQPRPDPAGAVTEKRASALSSSCRGGSLKTFKCGTVDLARFDLSSAPRSSTGPAGNAGKAWSRDRET